MDVLAVSGGDVAYWGLAVFLVALGLGSLFMLFKLGQLFGNISSFIRGTERDLLPVIVKAGGTVDRVNYQLDKADAVTDSAVSMADSADTAVRAVSYAIAKPVEKVSGFAAGIAHGFSSLRKTRKRRRRDGRCQGRGATARGRPCGGSPCSRDAAERRASRADAATTATAEAGAMAASRAHAQARPGAGATRRGSVMRLREVVAGGAALTLREWGEPAVRRSSSGIPSGRWAPAPCSTPLPPRLRMPAST